MTWKVLHLFCGLGGGALGFQNAGFESVGNFDLDEEACKDLTHITGESATPVDLAELQPAQLRRLCTGRPHVVFTSPPCKSFSGCLPKATSKTSKYKAMSTLAYRGIWLALEAWRDNPPPLFVMENVPRITSRGRGWLDDVVELLESYGYAVRETTHDCGELGGLAQSRRRFLMVARHQRQTPQWMYVPPKQRLKGIGEVIGDLPVPVPGCGGGPMHRLPRLSAMNWVRLALIRAGNDWHDIPDAVGLSPRASRHNGGYGVNEWDGPAHTVVGEGAIQNGWKSINDPRLTCSPRATAYGVEGWGEASGTVTGAACHDNGGFSISDPRLTTPCGRRDGAMGVREWDQHSITVIGNGRHHNGPWQVADPRLDYSPRRGTMKVQEYDEPSITVIGDSRQNKGHSIADPREAQPTHYVVESESGLMIVVGPELDLESTRSAKPVPIICAMDGTWHRPLTTLELAVIQGFPAKVRGEWLSLSGGSDRRWRQRIGNAVPPPAAEAIAHECAAVLQAAEDGGMILSAQTVWVEPEPESIRSNP